MKNNPVRPSCVLLENNPLLKTMDNIITRVQHDLTEMNVGCEITR